MKKLLSILFVLTLSLSLAAAPTRASDQTPSRTDLAGQGPVQMDAASVGDAGPVLDNNGISGPGIGVNIQQAPYYASFSAITTTVTGSASTVTTINVTSSASFVVGQGVLIGTSGATTAYIGTVLSVNTSATPNYITLVSAPLKVLDGSAMSTPPVAATNVQHDDSAAWNAAITALSTTGGTIRVPLFGFSRCNGPFLDTGGANAIINMPSIAPAYANASAPAPVTIAIAGVTKPFAVQTGVGSATVGIVPQLNGAIIQTDVDTGNLIGGYNSTAGGYGFTAVHLVLKNVILRSHDNPGITMVNALHCERLLVDGILVDTGVTAAMPSKPTKSSSFGLRLPTTGNYTDSIIHDSMVTGYFYAYDVGEHAYLDYTQSWMDFIGYQINGSEHPVYGSVVIAQECTLPIYAYGGPCRIEINQLDIEHGTNGNWWTTVADVYDPNNYLYGSIRAAQVNDSVGPVNTAPVITGGANLLVETLDDQVTLRRKSFDVYGTFASPITTNPLNLAANNAYDSVYYYGAVGQITLPIPAITGMKTRFYNTASDLITVNPGLSTPMAVGGTLYAAGNGLTLAAGAGNFVDLSYDGSEWVTAASSGTVTGNVSITRGTLGDSSVEATTDGLDISGMDLIRVQASGSSALSTAFLYATANHGAHARVCLYSSTDSTTGLLLATPKAADALIYCSAGIADSGAPGFDSASFVGSVTNNAYYWIAFLADSTAAGFSIKRASVATTTFFYATNAAWYANPPVTLSGISFSSATKGPISAYFSSN